jgi:NTP pyrophosphatase (non-canonical NTP hydrolase)
MTETMHRPKSDGSFSFGSDVWPGLAKLVEECGELQQVLGRLIATHGSTEHWTDGDLRRSLIEEMGDVSAAIEFLATIGLDDADHMELALRKARKLDLYWRWNAGEDVGNHRD